MTLMRTFVINRKDCCAQKLTETKRQKKLEPSLTQKEIAYPNRIIHKAILKGSPPPPLPRPPHSVPQNITPLFGRVGGVLIETKKTTLTENLNTRFIYEINPKCIVIKINLNITHFDWSVKYAI